MSEPERYSKPKREWASLSAAGIEVRWDSDHPLFAQGRAKIQQLIADGWIR